MKKIITTLIFFVFISPLVCYAQNPVTLWGITGAGGQYGSGTIYTITAIDTETIRASFLSQGMAPTGGLLKANNGLLYGMASEGGNYWGVLYSYDIVKNKLSALHQFAGAPKDGGFPAGKLIQAKDGLLYGITNSEGTYYYGTIFSYDIATDSEKILHNFGGGSDGWYPLGTLFQASNGLLYGTATQGGAHNAGIIYSYNISTGVETNLHNFGIDSDGVSPHGSFLQLNDSLLYGTTGGGGKHTHGTIFSFNIRTDSETVLYNFGAGTDGTGPVASLMMASDSLLYGTTSAGGLYGHGTLFSFNISTDSETDLHDFGSGNDGYQPECTPFQASNGLLYGSNTFGGTHVNDGAFFSYNISTGVETIMHEFGNGNDGTFPGGDLFEYGPVYASPLNSAICAGSPETINVSGATSYTWSPAVGLSATIGDSVIAAPTVTTTYTVTGTDTAGWTATDTIIVSVLPSPPQPTFIQHGDTLISSATSGNQWYINDSLIPRATHQTYVLTHSAYCVTLTVTDSATGCSSGDTLCLEGIQQISLQNYIKTFPNPFTNSVTLTISLSAGDLDNWNLQVTDVLGRTVYTLSPLNSLKGTFEIDLSNQPSGMYFISVLDGTNRAVLPVVKE